MTVCAGTVDKSMRGQVLLPAIPKWPERGAFR